MNEADIAVQVASRAADLPTVVAIRGWVRTALAAVPGQRGRHTEIAVRIVDEDEGRALNRQYRDQDKATNVLSFPAAADDAFAMPDDDEAGPLGDLVLCAPVIAGEAAAQGKRPVDHWAHMLVHGTLHLLGYDHQTASDASTMEALEIRILKDCGIGDPYRERDSA